MFNFSNRLKVKEGRLQVSFTLVILVPFIEIDKLFQLFVKLFSLFMLELTNFLCFLLFISSSFSLSVFYLDCFDYCTLESQYISSIGKFCLNFPKTHFPFILLEK